MRQRFKFFMVVCESLFLGCAAFGALTLAVVIPFVDAGHEPRAGAFVILLIAALGVARGWYNRRWNEGASGLDDIAVSAGKTWRKLDEPTLVGFEAAEKEVDEGTCDPEVWAEALVKAGGDEHKRKAAYMELRAAMPIPAKAAEREAQKAEYVQFGSTFWWVLSTGAVLIMAWLSIMRLNNWTWV